MRTLGRVLALAVLAACPAAAPENEAGREMPMTDNAVHVLSTSTDPEELLSTAAALVRSRRPEDHATLLRFLSQGGFLSRLDTVEDYEAGTKYLRISRIVRALRDSEEPGARQTIAGLSGAPDFLANDTRVELLIWASEVVRPPTERLLEFWDAYCRPDDCFNGLTTMALVRNGTAPAIALLERKFAEPGFEDEDRIWWMRTAVLTHRSDLLLLDACRRLLQGGLAEGLRPALVEVLFDDRPAEWHGPDGGYPAPKESTEVSRLRLLAIGEYALANVALPRPLEEKVRAEVESLKGE